MALSVLIRHNIFIEVGDVRLLRVSGAEQLAAAWSSLEQTGGICAGARKWGGRAALELRQWMP